MGTQLSFRRSATAAWYAPTPRRAGRGRLHGSRLADNVCGGKAPKPPAADQTVRVRLTRSGEDNAGGARRDRTADLLHAMQALSQLSYGPTRSRRTLRSRLYVVKRGRTATLSTRRPDARACVRARVTPGWHRSAATPPCRS